MKASIVHDEHGQIVAISKLDLAKADSIFQSLTMKPKPGHKMVEIDLDHVLRHKPLRELHDEYRVDVATSKLVRKP